MPGIPPAVVDEAILQALSSYGLTATPNGNQWNGGVSNPTNDPMTAYYIMVDEFDVTS